jgi:glycosyltransferase involved in cell wall biosynthesis
MVRRNILVIASDDFSGVRPALMAAFERAGCEVCLARQSLRELGVRRYWYVLCMAVSAWRWYGRSWRVLLNRTRAAFRARSRVNSRLVTRHADCDAVVLLTANSGSVGALPSRRPLLAVYTDYGNLLSKALPDRGFALDEYKVHPAWNALEREAFLAEDRVFVMGSHVKPALEAAYRLPPGKVVAVGAGPGLDLDIVRDAGSKDPGNRSVLFVGKLGPVKGLEVLLAAFARARTDFPDATLHVVTNERVESPGVVFHARPSAEALQALFYRCNIFSMPAFKEPLGLVYLEAMWSKCACIGTLTGSMPEMIQDGLTGYLVEPGDVAALAARLQQLFADPQHTRQMGERGYASVVEYWRWDGVVRRMLDEIGSRQPADRSELGGAKHR